MMSKRIKGILSMEIIIAICIVSIAALSIIPFISFSAKNSIIQSNNLRDIMIFENFSDEVKSLINTDFSVSNLENLVEKYNDQLEINELNLIQSGEKLLEFICDGEKYVVYYKEKY